MEIKIAISASLLVNVTEAAATALPKRKGAMARLNGPRPLDCFYIAAEKDGSRARLTVSDASIALTVLLPLVVPAPSSFELLLDGYAFAAAVKQVCYPVRKRPGAVAYLTVADGKATIETEAGSASFKTAQQDYPIKDLGKLRSNGETIRVKLSPDYLEAMVKQAKAVGSSAVELLFQPNEQQSERLLAYDIYSVGSMPLNGVVCPMRSRH